MSAVPLTFTSIHPARRCSDDGNEWIESQQKEHNWQLTQPALDDDTFSSSLLSPAGRMCENGAGLLRIAAEDDFQLSFLTQPMSHSQDFKGAEKSTQRNRSLLSTNESSDHDDDDEMHRKNRTKRLRFSLNYLSQHSPSTAGKGEKLVLLKEEEEVHLPFPLTQPEYYTQDDEVADENLYESQLSDNNDVDNVLGNCTSRPRCEMGSKEDFRLSLTQPVDYTQDETADEEASESFFLIDNHTKEHWPLLLEIQKDQSSQQNNKATKPQVFTIGRWPSSTVCCPRANKQIGSHHAQLVYDPIAASFTLHTEKKNTCFVLNGSKWDKVDLESRVDIGGSFRLLPKPNSNSNTIIMMPDQTCTQFTLSSSQRKGSVNPVGTASIDQEYLKLLQRIKKDGKPQTNEKGANLTLAEGYKLVVDLRSENKNLLPLTTLRYLEKQGWPAILEALWYLRGEDHIGFLQRLGQKFWNEQAKEDGWVGYNYGLLTSYEGVNQLEKNVIRRLVQNESSRNMACTLAKPNEKTVQNACTAGVQFAVTHEDDKEYLDLTVVQRSSDVILGLPHDMVAWTVILHLVRREVDRISGRKLHAGKLYFSINAGGAHVYMENENAFDTLLSRRPIPNIEPELIMSIDKTKSMFEFVNTYADKQVIPASEGGSENDRLAYLSSFDKMYPVASCDEQSSKVHPTPTPSLQIVGYTKEYCNPPIKIKQAIST